MRHATLQGIATLGALAVVALGSGVPPARAGGALPAAARSAAVRCQDDVTKAGLTFVGVKLKLLDKCADAAFTCLQITPADARCLEKAQARCAKALEKIAHAEDDFAARVRIRCADLDPLDVLAGLGLGYDALAAECNADFGTTLTDTDAIATCLVRQHECLAERLFQVHEPRAAELLDLVGIDLGDDACLEDFGGTGESLGDPALAKALGQCERAVRKAGTGFVVRKLKNVSACVRALFACAELDDGDPGCLDDARGKCDQAFAKTDAEALKLGLGVASRCRSLPIAAITEANGLGADALLDTCATLGVFGIGAINDYGNCVVRHHDCAVDGLLRFEAPRTGELFAEVERTLPGGFFCPSPTPTATPSPTPTATP